MSVNEAPIIFVVFGSIIMFINIIKYFSLASKISSMGMKYRKTIDSILFVYFLLLVFFLIGYIGVGVSFYVQKIKMDGLLIGLILFFGSIFVFIGIGLQMALSRAVESSNMNIIKSLIRAVEARDANLNGHSLHVARLTMSIYKFLPKEIQSKIKKTELEYAALLHDIGKLGIPESILNKEGPLDEMQWQQIKKHPLIGYDILCSLEQFQDISKWILYHHERYDGTGYYHIPCEQVPIASRIIAVADTYSAITMSRSYRPAQGDAMACEILKESSGTQFDPEIVSVFLSIPKEYVTMCKVEPIVFHEEEKKEAFL